MPLRLPFYCALAVLLLSGASLRLGAQCTFTEVTPEGFTFCYAGDSILAAGNNCTAPLDLVRSNPFFATVTVQTPPDGSLNFFSLDEALTGYGEDDPVPAGTLVDVAYAMNAQVNGTPVADTFVFRLRVADLTGPAFPGLPNDTTIACASGLPPAPTLDAVDACEGTVATVAPVALDDTTEACTAGELRYRYTATDGAGNTSTADWTVSVVPDGQPPVFAGTLVDTIENCETADYPAWLAATQQYFDDNLDDACGIDTSYNDGPATFGSACDTRQITFRAEDTCGNAVEESVTYTRIDAVAPVFAGLPPTPDTLVAGTPVPPADTLAVSDNCTAVPASTLLESSTQGNGGPCSAFTYTIDRTYNAADDCGNLTQFVQVLRIIDDVAPTFTLPADTLINCDAPTLPASTGTATNLADAADPTPVLTFTDELTGSDCQQAIIRSWIAVDACGNERRRNQLINIRDTLAPTFVVPTDRTVDCAAVNDPLATGVPTQVADNCTLQPAVAIANDAVSPGNCPNNYTILRTWRATDDCGNQTERDQLITVTDSTPPAVTTPPQDRNLSCEDVPDAAAAFQDWLLANGDAVLSDNCAAALTWVYFNGGTSTPAALPAAACPSDQFGTLYRQTVDFIASDGCGNTRSFAATFRVVDAAPPTVVACLPDTTLTAGAATCAATYSLGLPAVRDNCGGTDSLVQTSATATLTSSTAATDPANAFTPVDTVRLVLAVPPGPASATGTGQLTVVLTNADAEAADEFLYVYGEDGTLLGQTAPVPAQCGTAGVTFVLAEARLNAYTIDGAVRLVLVPNVPGDQPGSFAVNNVCGTTTATAELVYTARRDERLRYSYRVDGGTEQFVGADTVSLQLDGGAHVISSIFTDCAGRRDSCAHTVTVADRTPPQLACPADRTVALPADSCVATVRLPLPTALTDACATGVARTLGSGQQALTYAFDPNLNQYIAQGQTLALGGAVADATVTPVTLRFRWRADTEAADEFFTVRDENGELLLTTGPGGCGQPAEATLTVSAARYNGWAADGIVAFDVQPNPGLPGSTDGINPCNPGAVSADGDGDAITFLEMSLTYRANLLTYTVFGPTPIAPTPVTTAPLLALDRGEHLVTYTATDAAGNAGACSFVLVVADTTPPVALCAPGFVDINPAGAVLTSIDPSLLDANSRDNCGIDSLYVTPAAVSCNQVGDTVSVVLTVVDAAGNAASCNTFVAVRGIAPVPSFTVDCAAATLQLFANPPPATGAAFQYVWSGPNNFQSNQENPTIEAASEAQAGFYTVTITGVTGCTATGTVQVTVGAVPPAVPALTALRDSICAGEDFAFTVANGLPGDSYALTAADGTLAGVFTQLPIELPSGGLPEANYCYTLTTTRNGCTSAPSAQSCVFLTAVGAAVLAEDELIRCSGEQAVLEAVLPTEMGTRYRWVGPNFTQEGPQTQAVISALSAADDGNYRLTALRNGCVSVPDTAVVFVLETPATPTLFSSTSPTAPACAGATVTLSTNSPAAAYLWQRSDGTSFTTQEPELVLSNVTTAAAGFWTVRLTADNGCVSATANPVEVFVAPQPQPTAEASPTAICDGDDLQLFATSVPVAATYTWTGPDGFFSTQQNPLRPAVTNAAQGVYTVTVTTAAGCSATASVPVGSNSAIEITAISDNGSACPTGPEDITLSATVFPPDEENNYGYRWTRNGMLLGTAATLTLPEAGATAAGTYQLVVISPDGCASAPFPYTLAIGQPTATPGQPQLAGEATACTGGDVLLVLPNANYAGTVSYLWNTPGGGTVSTDNPSLALTDLAGADAGNYSVRVSVNGCVSPVSAPLPLVISPLPVVVATATNPVCSGETIQLQVTPLPGATYAWSGPNEFTATVSAPTIPNAAPALHTGSYSVTVRNAAGCTSAPATADVLVVPTPPAPLLAGPVSVCGETDSLRFSVATNPAGSTYEWTANGAPVAVGPDTTLVIPNVYTDGATPVFRVRRFLNDCPSDNSNAVTVAVNTVPNNSAVAGADQTVCTTSAQLSAAAPSTGTGAWTQTGGPAGAAIANPDAAQTPVNNLQIGQTYAFSWSLSNGNCLDYSRDTMLLSTVAANSIDGGPDIDTCGVDAVALQGNLPAVGTGVWTQPAVQELLDVVIAAPNDPRTEVSNFEPGGTYFFFYETDSECGEVRDTVRVFIRADQADAGADQEVCAEACTALAARLEFSENGRWLSDDPQLLFTDPTDPLTTVCGLSEGTNVVIWELNGGRCGAASYDTLRIDYRATATAVDDAYAPAPGQVIQFNVLDNDTLRGAAQVAVVSTPPRGTLRDDGDGNFSYTAPADAAGTFSFVYELCDTACGCTQATVDLVVAASDDCLPPTLITPNGDGINDVFLIGCLLQSADYPNNQLTVYNEWGGTVYAAAPYTNDWAGTYRGARLPAGTYFYVFDAGDGRAPVSDFLIIQ